MEKKKVLRREYHYSSKEDFHHFLWQRKHWNQGYAKALREHWYMGMYIPRDSLHREIHSKIHDVPVPNGKECKAAFEELINLDREGLLSEEDSYYIRLDFLIELWKDKCPATVEILKWQREIFSKFYSRE